METACIIFGVLLILSLWGIGSDLTNITKELREANKLKDKELDVLRRRNDLLSKEDKRREDELAKGSPPINYLMK